MKFEEYRRFDALGLAELVANKNISAKELLNTAIQRALQLDQLNAITIPMFDIAKQRAEESLQGPFAGVPFVIKDLMQDYAGVATTMGNKAMKAKNIKAEQHSEIVRRWLSSGVLVMGRSNTPEFGNKGLTEPEAWGPARNPWNTAYSPGGSSGGSAVAVAAGIVPIAGANDGGGSIRIPASHCGLFGFKPGRGINPFGPSQGENMHGAACNHILSRSVRDSAAMLDITIGPEIASVFHPQLPSKSFLEAINSEPRPLKIAFNHQSPLGTFVDKEARYAVESSAHLLRSLGHYVEEAAPSIDGQQLAKDFLTIWFVQASLDVDKVRSITHCSSRAFELDTRVIAAIGRKIAAEEYASAYQRWLSYTYQMGVFYQQYDVYMTPTVASTPPKIGEVATPRWQRPLLKTLLALGAGGLLKSSRIAEHVALDNLKWVPFTQLANMTGMPAMSVPLYWCQNGMPLGVQFMGPHSSETRLLQLAAQLEQAQPWFHHIAPV